MKFLLIYSRIYIIIQIIVLAIVIGKEENVKNMQIEYFIFLLTMPVLVVLFKIGGYKWTRKKLDKE